MVGWTGNISGDGRTQNINGTGPISFDVRALDYIGQLDFMDEFHVWLGRMLTPVDRSNLSGAWFVSPWNYPGIYNVYVGRVVPKKLDARPVA